MRLLMACLLIVLAPAGALFLSDRAVTRSEREFQADASSQIARLDRVMALYPPNVRKMKSAPAIVQLKRMPGGSAVAAAVCGAPGSSYGRLFERLTSRCGDWALHRRARRAALLGAAAALAAVALILLARITVQRYAGLDRSPGNWSLWFVLRGIPALLACQIAAALLGYGVLLRAATGGMLTAAAILVVPFAFLFWIERRLVLAFVEPGRLAALGPKRASRGRRRVAPA